MSETPEREVDIPLQNFDSPAVIRRTEKVHQIVQQSVQQQKMQPGYLMAAADSTDRHRHCERKSDIDLKMKIKNVQNEIRTRQSVSYGTDFCIKRSKTKISEPRFSENGKFYRGGAKTLGEKGQIFPPNRDSMVDTIPNPRKL